MLEWLFLNKKLLKKYTTTFLFGIFPKNTLKIFRLADDENLIFGHK